jgi:hypothetical protein
MLRFRANTGAPITPIRMFISDAQLAQMKRAVQSKVKGVLSTQDCLCAFIYKAYSEAVPDRPIRTGHNVFNVRFLFALGVHF